MQKTKTSIYFHSLLVKKDNLGDKKIIAVYLPEQIKEFLINIQKNNFERELRLSEFRSIIQGRYKEVIWISFKDTAFNQIEPWLYLANDAPDSTGTIIYIRFLNWIERLLEAKKMPVTIPKQLRDERLTHKDIFLHKAFEYQSGKKVIASWLLYHFTKEKKTLTWDVPNSQGIDKEIQFPDQWYYCFNGQDYEAVSEPIHITSLKSDINEGKQYGSYVISLHFEGTGNSDEYILHFKTSLRRWIYKPIMRNGQVFFPRNNNRSLYIIKEERNGGKMIRFPMNKYNGRAYLSFYKQTIEMFQELGYTPNLPVIMQKPNEFYHSAPLRALIPYQQDDKSYPNLLETGISKIEKTRIFDMFTEVFPFLENAHPEPRSINTLRTTLKGGSVVLDHPLPLVEDKLLIEIISKNDRVSVLLEEALYTLTKDLADHESRFQLEKKEEGKYILIDRKQGCYIDVTIKSRKDLIVHTQPLSVENGGKLAAERKRKKEIIEAVSPDADIIYTLIEIDDYKDNDDSDPKKALEQGFLEVNRLTQCFHPIEDLKEEEQLQKIRSCLADILARKGFVNQMIGIYQESFSKHVYYFPVCLPAKSMGKDEGFIYVMVKMEDGNISVKYNQTDWMSLEGSLAYLTLKNREKLFQKKTYDFIRFIEEEAIGETDIVVFQKDELPDYYESIETVELPYIIAFFDHSRHRNPYIDNQDKNGVPSTGTFIVESRGAYYAVPPKLKSLTGKNSNTKQDVNKPFQTRHTLRINLSKPDDEIAVNLHLMRGLPITFSFFINNPLPYHLMSYHRKLI